MLSAYAEQRRSLHDHVDQAFREPSINEFSSRMEEAHGWVHGVIGGGWTTDSHQGHMWPLEYSAFEPMFMLHHTCVFHFLFSKSMSDVVLTGDSNVDRLFAMYQSTHPERNFDPQNIANNGNVFLEDGQMVDGDTQLLPFRKPGASRFWTTNDVTDTRVFGYTYPETSSGQDTGAAIARLYSSSARALLRGMETSISAKHVVAGTQDANTDDITFTDWFVHCATTSSPSTFIAQFFLSAPSNSDPSGNVSLPIGRWVKMVEDSSWSLPIHMNGTVSLTASLLDRVAAGELVSLEHEDVVPYLTERLNWVVLDVCFHVFF
jgi:tyrosinase